MKFQIIGAHWYSRPQTLRECTEQTLNFLEALKDHNLALFGLWFEKGFSKKEASSRQVSFEYESIKRLFTKRGKDSDYPKVSFATGIWNGVDKEGESASLSVSLGSAEKKYFTNNCVIELPYEGEQHAFYQLDGNQKLLVSLLKHHWRPEWIMIDNSKVSV